MLVGAACGAIALIAIALILTQKQVHLNKSAVSQTRELAEAKKLTQQVRQLFRRGKYTEVIPLAKRSLALQEKALGKEHPDVADIL